MAGALGATPLELLRSRRLLAVFPSEDAVRALRPDFARLAAVDSMGVIVTAPAAPESGADFVSRYFAPRAGVPEDPVTGSAHCVLAPFWAARLGKRALVAHQVSARGGELFCEEAGGRVRIGGHAVLYLEGTAHL